MYVYFLVCLPRITTIVPTVDQTKFVDLLDSVFIVLRKTKPLSFLHVFHHAMSGAFFISPIDNRTAFAGVRSMVPAAMFWIEGPLPMGWFACLFNSFVHVLMYGYYAMCVLGYRINWIRKYLTAIQISQFVTGPLLFSSGIDMTPPGFLVTATYIIIYHSKNINCLGDARVFIMCIFLDLAFFYLFFKFYINEYSKRKSLKSDASRTFVGVHADKS